jgi:hypothetical protein
MNLQEKISMNREQVIGFQLEAGKNAERAMNFSFRVGSFIVLVIMRIYSFFYAFSSSLVYFNESKHDRGQNYTFPVWESTTEPKITLFQFGKARPRPNLYFPGLGKHDRDRIYTFPVWENTTETEFIFSRFGKARPRSKSIMREEEMSKSKSKNNYKCK